LDALIVGPVLKLVLSKLVDFPSLKFQQLCGQLLHLAWLAVEWPGVLVQVEIDCDFKFFEHVVQLNETVVADELRRINVAVAI
jgi:hypothetical protein